MTNNPNPMGFFRGSRRGIYISHAMTTELLGMLAFVTENMDVMERTLPYEHDSYRDAPELYERLMLVASSDIGDALMDVLKRYGELTDEAKFDALRMAIGRLAEEA